MVLIQERGVVAGTRVGVVILVPVFSCSFGCCISSCLRPFAGAILVAIRCLDKGWILAWSFGCLFLLLFWLALSLLSCSLFWSLLLCSWVPGTVLVPVSDNFGCDFLQFWLLFSAFDET